MALTVREIRAWLDTLDDNDLVGIHEDDMSLTLTDEHYGLAELEIGMALSSDYLTRQHGTVSSSERRLTPDEYEAKRNAEIDAFLEESNAQLRTTMSHIVEDLRRRLDLG